MQLLHVLATVFALFGGSFGAVTFSTLTTTTTIDENVAVGTTLMTLAATADGGGSVTFSISGQTPSGKDLYVVDASSGVITVAPGKTIDAETDASHTLTVTGTGTVASDTETTTVTVTVTDLNDNKPTFSAGLTGVLAASAKTGTVGTYVAADGDVGPPNNVIASYILDCKDTLEVSNAGVVTVKDGATGPEAGCYTTVITAVDSGTTPGALTGSGTVSITVGGGTCTTDDWTPLPCAKSTSPSLTFSLMALMIGLLANLMK